MLVESYARGYDCQSGVFSGICVRSGDYENDSSLFANQLQVFYARALL